MLTIILSVLVLLMLMLIIMMREKASPLPGMLMPLLLFLMLLFQLVVKMVLLEWINRMSLVILPGNLEKALGELMLLLLKVSCKCHNPCLFARSPPFNV